jgi:hypothetical protein
MMMRFGLKKSCLSEPSSLHTPGGENRFLISLPHATRDDSASVVTATVMDV